jgi:membrane protein implicated in regulation of membrane protease activity
MQVEWWHWIIAGLCVIGIELIFPSFTILWFGLGALAVGILKALWPDLSPVAQVVLWPVASICFTLMWFKYLKPKTRSKAAISGEGIVGETGIVIREADAGCDRWTVRLHAPVRGAEEWCCYSDEVLQVGDPIRVTEIEGQILKVTRIR